MRHFITFFLIFEIVCSTVRGSAKPGEDYAGESFIAPNHQFSICTFQKEIEEGNDAYIQLINQTTKEVLFSLHLQQARAIDALWNPSSELVAISMEVRPNTGQMQVFRKSSDGLTELRLPTFHINDFLKKDDPARQLTFQHFYICPIEWQTRRDLICEVSGVAALLEPNASGEGSMPTQGYLSVTYLVTLRWLGGKMVVHKIERIEYEKNE